jgi:hypothetical protein
MVQDLPTNITNGRLSGNVKYIEHDDGTWSFRLTIYVSEEPPILIGRQQLTIRAGTEKDDNDRDGKAR